MQPPCLHQAINCRLLWLCYIWYHFDCITRAVASKPHGAHSTSLYAKRTSHSVNTLPNDKCKLDCRQAGETGEIQLKKKRLGLRLHTQKIWHERNRRRQQHYWQKNPHSNGQKTDGNDSHAVSHILQNKGHRKSGLKKNK